MEQNNLINFLTIASRKLSKEHNFSSIHKHLHTDITIHYSTLHPSQHKLSQQYTTQISDN